MQTQRFFSSLALLPLLAIFSGCSGSDDDGKASSGVHTPGGGSGGEAAPGPTPEGGRRFFLPTPNPDNTSPPMIVADMTGNVHGVYPAYAKGGAYYAFCGGNCNDASGVKVVRFETPDGTVTNASIALDAQGHPRVLLNAFHNVYYATCDANCGEQASWTVNAIHDHGGKLEVSGEALALDPQGHPRFLMHTYRTYLGIGQGPSKTLWASCDADCGNASAWTTTQMQDEVLEAGHLRIDGKGVVHLAAVTSVPSGDRKVQGAAYLRCAGNCGSMDGWRGIGLGDSFSSETDAFAIKPAVALALTKNHHPRVALIARNGDNREIHYQECDADDCSEDHWKGQLLSDNAHIGAGIDLAVDQNDRPRLAYTLGWNIAVVSCSGSDCTGGGDNWTLTPVEKGSDMPPDQIFLYSNCNVSAWFLMSPSLALTPSDELRVGYQARDASGGFGHPDSKNTDCVAGTDMAWDRIAYLPAIKK